VQKYGLFLTNKNDRNLFKKFEKSVKIKHE